MSCGDIWTVCPRIRPYVVDRCRVWESHADSAAVRRLSKPGARHGFPTYTVRDPDGREDDLRVATVAPAKSTPDQVEGFFSSVAGERSSNTGSDPETRDADYNIRLLHNLLSGSLDRNPYGGIGMHWCVFPAASRAIVLIVVPPWMTLSLLCCWDGWWRRRRVCDDFTPSGSGAAAERQRSGSGAAAERQRSGSGAEAERQRSGSGAAAERQRSGSGAAAERQRSGSGAVAERQRSGSGAAAER